MIFLYLERVIVLNEIKVSVVIPVYNRADVIYTSIISVLEQNGDFPIEIIIVDDFSDDRIKLLKNVNKII
ncbi:glycosyltransferase, partial [Vibrio diabolicus]|uniref:glycosyltransferase n=1 Tax=Vibrio diabolicus TaxID=50719 RepID=UPI003D342B87